MPAAFDRCVRSGGRVRRRTLSDGRYQNICFKDGESQAGYVKKKKPRRKGK